MHVYNVYGGSFKQNIYHFPLAEVILEFSLVIYNPPIDHIWIYTKESPELMMF